MFFKIFSVDLYLKKTRTAETAIAVSIDRSGKEGFKLFESSNIDGRNYMQKYKINVTS